MNLLSYTLPEERFVPITMDYEPFSCDVCLGEDDPLWRRFLIGFALRLFTLGERLFNEDRADVTWRDHARWAVDDLAMSVFCLGHDGSVDQARMIFRGEIPWKYVETATRLRLFARYPTLFREVKPEDRHAC